MSAGGEGRINAPSLGNTNRRPCPYPYPSCGNGLSGEGETVAARSTFPIGAGGVATRANCRAWRQMTSRWRVTRALIATNATT